MNRPVVIGIGIFSILVPIGVKTGLIGWSAFLVLVGLAALIFMNKQLLSTWFFASTMMVAAYVSQAQLGTTNVYEWHSLLIALEALTATTAILDIRRRMYGNWWYRAIDQAPKVNLETLNRLPLIMYMGGAAYFTFMILYI